MLPEPVDEYPRQQGIGRGVNHVVCQLGAAAFAFLGRRRFAAEHGQEAARGDLTQILVTAPDVHVLVHSRAFGLRGRERWLGNLPIDRVGLGHRLSKPNGQ